MSLSLFWQKRVSNTKKWFFGPNSGHSNVPKICEQSAMTKIVGIYKLPWVAMKRGGEMLLKFFLNPLWNILGASRFIMKINVLQKPMSGAKGAPTGWSLKTVDCNVFLTDPKNSKNAKTQWFLESLYREVLVFWCFKTVRCVKICLLKLFQYRAIATQYKAWTLLYSIIACKLWTNQ